MKWLALRFRFNSCRSNLYPSLGVGYEIGRAIEANKQIICLYRESSNNKLSAMISGSKNIDTLKYYHFHDIQDALERYFKNHVYKQ